MAAQAREQKERDDRLQREGRAATMVTLASGVAHEISTPLGVIMGRAEQLLRQPGQDERAARSLQIILEQSEDIRQVIRGFLGLARGGSPALQSADPAAVLASAVALVEHRFADAKVELRVRPTSALPPIRCDPRLLEHALVNLMLNACDACAAGGGGAVEVTARADGAAVAFEVLDDGTGIAPDVAARATEPFFSTKPVEQGTGLGLAIASEIVKSHRGSLEVGPRAGARGTAARVRVPLMAGAADA
jgi:signal transduction histidine kinase